MTADATRPIAADASRTRRSCCIADAGFVATGVLADGAEAGGTGGGMSTHRSVAIGSMAVSTVGWLIMTDLFRKWPTVAEARGTR